LQSFICRYAGSVKGLTKYFEHSVLLMGYWLLG
jgi:hypothetical protein